MRVLHINLGYEVGGFSQDGFLCGFVGRGSSREICSRRRKKCALSLQNFNLLTGERTGKVTYQAVRGAACQLFVQFNLFEPVSYLCVGLLELLQRVQHILELLYRDTLVGCPGGRSQHQNCENPPKPFHKRTPHENYVGSNNTSLPPRLKMEKS